MAKGSSEMSPSPTAPASACRLPPFLTARGEREEGVGGAGRGQASPQGDVLPVRRRRGHGSQPQGAPEPGPRSSRGGPRGPLSRVHLFWGTLGLPWWAGAGFVQFELQVASAKLITRDASVTANQPHGRQPDARFGLEGVYFA